MNVATITITIEVLNMSADEAREILEELIEGEEIPCLFEQTLKHSASIEKTTVSDNS